LLEIGQTDLAIAILEESVRLAPDSAAGQLDLAEAYATAGRSAAALTHARRALDLARQQHDMAMAQQVETWLAAHPMSE